MLRDDDAVFKTAELKAKIEGKNERSFEISRKQKLKGIDNETIIETTGLRKDQIDQL